MRFKFYSARKKFKGMMKAKQIHSGVGGGGENIYFLTLIFLSIHFFIFFIEP